MHSNGITSASPNLLQVLILQLMHVTPSPGSHSIFTGVPAQSFSYKAHGITFSHQHHNYLLSVTLS
ncbi:hypothetical protein AHAS_Ahas09G0173800 [Arachis hypogaea]